MPTCIIDSQNARVSLERKHLIMRCGQEKKRVPLNDIDRVMIVGRPGITIPVLLHLRNRHDAQVQTRPRNAACRFSGYYPAIGLVHSKGDGWKVFGNDFFQNAMSAQWEVEIDEFTRYRVGVTAESYDSNPRTISSAKLPSLGYASYVPFSQ